MRFLREFLRDPAAVGAVAPSGPALARLMVEAADLRPGHRVVELGGGTGAFTAVLAPRAPSLLVLEPNPRFAEVLSRRVPGARVLRRGAEELPGLIDGPVDRVISGLPFALWGAPAQEAVLDAVVRSLGPGGRFVTFGYLQSQLLPRARQFRSQLDRRFSDVQIAGIAWWNLPPALVWSCAGARAGEEER